MTQTRRLLSTAQVAELLGRSIRTVQRMAETGEIPAEKMPGRTGGYVFDGAVIEVYARQQQREAS